MRSSHDSSTTIKYGYGDYQENQASAEERSHVHFASLTKT